MTAALNEQQQWVDEAGKPVVAGKVFFGSVQMDPVTFPIEIFGTADFSGPDLDNPQTTDMFGRTTDKVYVPGLYSIRLEDSGGSQLYEELFNGTTISGDDLPPDYLTGYVLSINASDPQKFDITNGAAKDDTDSADIILNEPPPPPSYTKGIVGTYTEGDGGSALDMGTTPVASKQYFVFAIKDPSLDKVDILISTSEIDPSFPAGFTLKALIGTMNLNVASQIENIFGRAETISGITLSEGDMSGVFSLNESGVWGFRRMNPNGAMKISQQGEDQTIVPDFAFNTDTYFVDQISANGDSTPEVRANLDHAVTEPPEGFPNYARVDITTAETGITAPESAFFEVKLEAQNLQHLLYGSASARTIAISFLMRSPKTGFHNLAIIAGDADKSYVANFNVFAANAWEPHTVIIDGDPLGGINDDTGQGLAFRWPLFTGSDFETGSGNQWISGEFMTTPGQQNLADSDSNNIDITGIQIEVVEIGATRGTAFEYLPFDVELERCHRYFEQRDYDNAPDEFVAGGNTLSATDGRGFLYYSKKRVAPTIGTSPAISFGWIDTATRAISVIAGARIGTQSAELACTLTGAIPASGGFIRRDGTDPCFIKIDANL